MSWDYCSSDLERMRVTDGMSYTLWQEVKTKEP